jgi:hypothetical protein
MMLAKAGLTAVAVAAVIALAGATTAQPSPLNMARLYQSRGRLLKSSTIAAVLLHRIRFAGLGSRATGFVDVL